MKHISALRAFTAGFAILGLAYFITTTLGELGHTSFDDAYMFTRYAKHWLAGAGFSWNPADGPSYGLTSVSYLFVITAVLGLTGCSDALALTGTSFVAGLLSSLALVLLGFLIQGSKWSRRSWMPVLVIPSLLLVPPFRYHSLTGMDTTLSLLANSLLACSVVGCNRRRSNPALALCLLSGYLSFLTRPDNGLYALLLPPLFFVATDRSLWRYSSRYAVFFILILGLDLVLKQSLFGGIVPLPFFAKSSGFYQGYLGAHKWNPMTAMLCFWIAALPSVLLIVSTATRRTLKLLVAIAVPVIATFGYYTTVTQISGGQARYYYPSLPFFLLGAFMALTSSTEEVDGPPASYGPLGWRVLIGLVVLLPVLSPFRSMASRLWESSAIGTPTASRPNTQYRTSTGRNLPPLRWWNGIKEMTALLERMPKGVVLAASEYGIIGSHFPDMTIIDLVGLHDKIIAQGGFSAKYVFSRKPDIIWFPHSDYTHEVAEILDSDTFALRYAYYPGAYDYGIALRKTSSLFSAMKMEAEEEFLRVYSGLRMSDYIAEPVALPDKE